MEKWVNHPKVSINEENLKNLGLKETFIKSNDTKRCYVCL